MAQLTGIRRDIAYLLKCLRATYLTLRGHTVVYSCFINGAFLYEYVTDFKKCCGIFVLGTGDRNKMRNFATGIIELENPPAGTINHSIHVLKKQTRNDKL